MMLLDAPPGNGAAPERSLPAKFSGPKGFHSSANPSTNTPSTKRQQFLGVRMAVSSARYWLLDATFRLDDMDYSCLALDDLHDSVATLLAEWSGRLRPTDYTEEPAHIVKAAIEWRSERARRMRR